MIRGPKHAQVRGIARMRAAGPPDDRRFGTRVASVAAGHKRTLLDLLVRYPAGLTTLEAASQTGLGLTSVRRYLDELRAEGFVESTGARPMRWNAAV